MFKSKRKREREARLKVAAMQNKYLIEAKGDVDMLRKMIQLVNDDPDLHVQFVLSDGTHLNVWSTANRNEVRNIWTGEEY